MANVLKMADVKAILALRERGWSCRRISKELHIHRETVGRYVKLAETDAQNRPDPPPGSPTQNQPNPPPGSSGPSSLCEPYRELIQESLELGLSRQRIWQDLRYEHGFAGGYDSVKRFVRGLGSPTPLPFRRMECEPGQEAQVDFGAGAPVIGEDGRRRRTHVIRVVLSYSRKAYSEAVFKQTTESFIRCLENAFRCFGGVPLTLVIDNLKAAVKKADWYDPELNPKILSFCEHYGVTILPARPYTPRHKGKVEKGVDYVKDNALKGLSFEALREENRHLVEWESRVADTRIHGTTRRQVGQVFREVEKAALKPLPAERFPFFKEAERTVHRDGHVEVERAYYSAPPEYLGARVWARWDGQVVRLYNRRLEQIAIHLKKEPGRFSTLGPHIASQKISGIEKGAEHLLKKADLVGPQTSRWASQMLLERGIEGVRVLVGLLSLTTRYPSEEVERACRIAADHHAWRLRHIRELLKRKPPCQQELEFIGEHPLIRPMSSYAEVVKRALEKE